MAEGHHPSCFSWKRKGGKDNPDRPNPQSVHPEGKSWAGKAAFGAKPDRSPSAEAVGGEFLIRPKIEFKSILRTAARCVTLAHYEERTPTFHAFRFHRHTPDMARRGEDSPGRISLSEAPAAPPHPIRKRAPNLSQLHRFLLGLWTLLINPGQLAQNAVIVKPSTRLRLHETLVNAKNRLLFASCRKRRPEPRGLSLANCNSPETGYWLKQK